MGREKPGGKHLIIQDVDRTQEKGLINACQKIVTVEVKFKAEYGL